MDSRSNSETNTRWYVVWNVLILVMVCLAGLLTYQSHLTSVHIEKIRSDIESRMELISQQSSSHLYRQRVVRSVQNEADTRLGQPNATENSDLLRQRQHTQESEISERTRSKRKNKKRSRKNKSAAAHFVAYIDEDRINRELAEGKLPRFGNLTEHGFTPKDRVYNIWKPESYSNKKVFKYNETSGKVTISRSGLYLIYGQIVFFGPHSRVSYGIHINDDTTPFIEAMAFNLGRHRLRREAIYDMEGEVVPNRHRRSTGKYHQCNTLAVTYMNKGDKVFVRSLEMNKSIVPRKYLTFWGIAAL